MCDDPLMTEQQVSLDEELRMLREIENEVQSILKKSRKDRREINERVYYFKLNNLNRLDDIWKVIEEMNVILISLDGLGLNDLKNFITELKKRVSDENIYLIRWPILLILPRHMKLIIHD